MITLSGLICLRNGDDLDYCWREAIQSLLPVCDEVVICEGESTDGTQEAVRKWMESEPKLKLCIYPWPDPKGDVDFYVNWIQFGRAHIAGDFLLHCDADEIISEHTQQVLAKFRRDTKPKDRISLKGHRYNFWKDAYHLIPHGVCLSHIVTRVAPRDVFMPSDGAHVLGDKIENMSVQSRVTFYHYGFLRRSKAYFEKSRQLHTMFFGSMSDQRLADAEKSGKEWMAEIRDVEWTNRLLPYEWDHPEIIKPWLRERGHL